MYYSISGVKCCIFWRDAVVTVGSGQMSLVHTSEKYGITDTEITTTCIFLLIVLSMNDWSTFFLYCVSWRRVACLVCWLLLAVCHCLSMGALYISLSHTCCCRRHMVTDWFGIRTSHANSFVNGLISFSCFLVPFKTDKTRTCVFYYFVEWNIYNRNMCNFQVIHPI